MRQNKLNLREYISKNLTDLNLEILYMNKPDINLY